MRFRPRVRCSSTPRLLPGESSSAELGALRAGLRDVSDATTLELTADLASAPFEPSETDPHPSPLAPVLDAVSAVTGERFPTFGTPSASDMRNLVLGGHMAALTFGPGARSRTPNDLESLTELGAATGVFLAYAARPTRVKRQRGRRVHTAGQRPASSCRRLPSSTGLGRAGRAATPRVVPGGSALRLAQRGSRSLHMRPDPAAASEVER
jgi:hypothetical protein